MSRHRKGQLSSDNYGLCTMDYELWTVLHLLHRLFQVGNNVIDVLYADAEANEVGSHACLAKLLVAELAVGVAGGVQHTGTGIGHMRHDADEVQVVHEADGFFLRAFQTEGNHTTGALRQVLLSQSIVLVRGQTCIVHPAHLRVLLQPLGHLLRILAMASHAEVERLQSEVEQEGVLRCGNAAQVAHQLSHELRRVGHLAEGLRVGQTVVRLVGCAKAGELLCVLVPIEVAAIHNHAANLSGVTVHVLRRGVRHDVAAPFKGTAVDGCGKGVIDDERHAVLVRHLGKALDVEHVAAWVRDGLAEEALRVGAEASLDAFVVPVGVDEGALDAELLQRHAEEVERAAVDSVGGDEVVASLTDVEDGVEVRRLSAAGQHSAHAAFEGSNLLSHGIVRRVSQAGIEVAAVLEVEETRHLVARLVAEGCALIDRQLLRFALLGLPSAVDADGLEVPLFHNI